ncbi:serine/threonine protein kinase [Oscillatoria sp. CS-180]|uniref:serine/threonine-protein kinase n=1 Tax=Oscillatoria sp. CS-180 TaxID=3021720 RepID=UPI00232DF82E|nr:serine/threonine-protein kinase [Oscillatoria sp. CS-180]MDB9528378.1 serine/threonine protein kinase [Oscillatoria sp. CS-180]
MNTLCINPQCPQPQNSDDRDRCQSCGAQLLLGGRFRPLQQLGQGGFGRTFLALDEAQQPFQKCVVKQILPSATGSAEDARQRTIAEAERLSYLGQHPQIPELIAVLESSRDICLVQAFIPGKNLEQTLSAEGPLGEARVRSLLLALLPVLTFIHEQGIIHRDIKPENILLPDTDDLPVLVDFGAARTLLTATELRHTGTVIGSAGYAAPEQALGKAVPASDLYGLGMTCVHLLTGEHPFNLYSVAEDRWIWKSFVASPVGITLTRVLNKLIARPLANRYGSATSALADLDPAGVLTAKSPSQATITFQTTATRWRCTQVWTTPGRVANALAISPDGRAIATANSDNSVQLWDRQTGDLVQTFSQRLGFGSGHTDAVVAVAFHPAGQLLLTGSRDSTVKLWDLRSYRLLQTLQQPGWQVRAIALSPNGDRLATADTEGRIALWDTATAQRSVDLIRHSQAVNDLIVSPDGRRLISVGEEGTLRLWTIPEGQLLHTWTAKAGLRTVQLSTVESALITGSSRGHLETWSLTDLKDHSLLAQRSSAITEIALSADNQLLAVGGHDSEIRLWQWRANQCFAKLYHDWAIRDLLFQAEDNSLISSAADETIRFWQAAVD